MTPVAKSAKRAVKKGVTKAEKEPFHPVAIRRNDKHVGYDIYVKNVPFLKQNTDDDEGKLLPLKRHEAYAIAALLNKERRLRKWADKFADPYV